VARSTVVAHPANLVNNDALNISVPIFFVMPQTDGFNALYPYFNTTLIERGIPSLFKIYPNTTHGFTVNNSNPAQKQIAFTDSLAWFHKWALNPWQITKNGIQKQGDKKGRPL